MYSVADLDEIELAVDINGFRMSWIHICEGLKHEMYPKLASAIRQIIQVHDAATDIADSRDLKVGLYDIKANIDKAIDYLKTKRKLAVEERNHLKDFIERAIEFALITINNKS